jgi:hypothetical protein
VLYQLGPGLDAINMAGGQVLEIQVVQNEAQVGFTCPMVRLSEGRSAIGGSSNNNFSMNWNG